MIKNKSFLNGLGLGLILGAVLLQLMFLGQAASSTDESKTEWTREELEQAADSINLRVLESQEELMTEEEWSELQKQDEQQQPTGSDNQQGGAAAPKASPADQGGSLEPAAPFQPESPEKTTAPEAKAPAPAAEPAPQKSAPPAAPEAPKAVYIKYSIPPGAHLSDVAAGLKQSGVIQDAAAFVTAATEKKINLSIQQGTFTFRKGESFGSIMEKITSKPQS
ncbi:endolytic transglycosylase MltG [Paenibacillus sp. F411]|uniref:endolytic transglycosylase MltG n=1 Tax=Paenibacillus sp. F411 TaxID=2820239 RepID=UPI001AAFC4ED|nr:endolytic transglycosylase MltG [Paenibacillus sp. F411]MBO2945726.1 endolytic transglycosylase MltG [Paenibacillus sp. F411]